MQDRQARLAVINGLRGVAILGVVWHHTVYKLWLQPEATSPTRNLWEPLSALLNSGWLGVNLFFMLSGFVLYLPYADGRRDVSSRAQWVDFYRRRAFRLLPLFYISLLVFTLADLAIGRPIAEPHQLATQLLLTFNFQTETFFPKSNWVLWSLGVEIWFSLLFPLVVYLIARHGITRVLVAVIILSFVVRVAGSQPELLGPGDRLNPMKDGILGRLDDFLVGTWICDAYVRKRLKQLPTAPLTLFGISVGLLSAVAWERVLDGSASQTIIPLLNNGVQLGSAALVVGALTMRNKLIAVLTCSPMQILGMMCFSVYVWHGRPIEALLEPRFGLFSVAVYLVLASIAAVLSYRFIEFPQSKSWKQLFEPAASTAVANQRR